MSQDSLLFICFTQSDTATLLNTTRERKKKRNNQQQSKLWICNLNTEEHMGKAGGNSKLQVSSIAVCLLQRGGTKPPKMLSGFPQPHPCWAHGWMLSGFGPLPRREHPASASMAFGGSYLPASWQGWRETKKDQTNSCCCCTAQEAWSIYQFE